MSDNELLHRLRASYIRAVADVVAKELAELRQSVKDGLADESLVKELHERYTCRMDDLGEFMKTLLLRFSRWFKTRHERTGALWGVRDLKTRIGREGRGMGWIQPDGGPAGAASERRGVRGKYPGGRTSERALLKIAR